MPALCISRHLFCDGVDNCGRNADEEVHVAIAYLYPARTAICSRPKTRSRFRSSTIVVPRCTT
jgi:hypothetical protein